jgi:hypothetical protein
VDDRDRYESTDAPADDEERELMDPETWDWESDPVELGRVRTLYEISVVLPKESYRPLKALAARHGVTPAQLAFRYLTERIEVEQDATAVDRGYAESA